MNSSLLRNYKALARGGIISIGLVIILNQLEEFFILDPAHTSTTVRVVIHLLLFIFCWLGISHLTTKFPVYKIFGVLVLLLVSVLAEYNMDIRENPITIPLLILFWLGVTYLILPEFFNKYKLAILSVYGLIIFYYFFIFITISPDSENHRLNFSSYILLPIPAFGALWVYEQWRWVTSLKADKTKAELTLLKSQINPHFFFNTLNNLYGLAVEKSDDAPAMILKLSDIMRYTIYDGKADYVPLKNEVAYLEDYIELHKIRYHRKVDISFQAKLEHTHQIAPLLLIVPLENAFKHGVESMAKDAFIELDISTSPKGISFRIVNSYEANELESGGIGLDNLKKRLALIYPNQHELEITQSAGIYTVHLEIESYELSNH